MNLQENFMINTSPNTQRKVSVVFELSADGTVLYFRDSTSANDFSADLKPSPIGRNFLEMEFLGNTAELWRRYNSFLKSHDSVENFKFMLNVDNQPVPTKVMLMRVIERSNNKRAQSIIVDIRSV